MITKAIIIIDIATDSKGLLVVVRQPHLEVKVVVLKLPPLDLTH